jgi:hypothetical protein
MPSLKKRRHCDNSLYLLDNLMEHLMGGNELEARERKIGTFCHGMVSCKKTKRDI